MRKEKSYTVYVYGDGKATWTTLIEELTETFYSLEDAIEYTNCIAKYKPEYCYEIRKEN